MHSNGVLGATREQQMFGLDGLKERPAAIDSECGARPTGKVTTKSLRDLLDYQKYRCALTNIAITPDTVALDHIVPIAKGGADDMTNVQLVHTTVNTMKGSLDQDEFIRWCRLIVQQNDLGTSQ